MDINGKQILTVLAAVALAKVAVSMFGLDRMLTSVAA